MKTRWMAMAFVLSAVPALAWTSLEGGQEKASGRLVRVQPKGQGAKAAEGFDRDAWRRKITAGDLAERESAFAELAGIARHDPAAREALEAWSKDESASELAWTSRLILREANSGPHAWTREGSVPGWGLFGKDFDLDGFSRRFEELDSVFGDLHAQWSDILKGLPNPSAGSRTDTSRTMTLQHGPDGVTCKVTETVDGQETTREYTAKSMEELLETNPELRSKLGNDGTMAWAFPDTFGRGQVFRVPSPQGGRIEVFPRRAPGEVTLDQPSSGMRTDRLGIFCRTLEPDEARELDLEEGQGLRVDSTQPGSIASVLGLREGDVVVEINGTKIGSPDDVRKVLADRAEGAEVGVVVVGSEGRRTLTWKPAAKKSDSTDSKSGSRPL